MAGKSRDGQRGGVCADTDMNTDELKAEVAELKRLAERFNTTPEMAVTVALAFAITVDGVLETQRTQIATLAEARAVGSGYFQDNVRYAQSLLELQHEVKALKGQLAVANGELPVGQDIIKERDEARNAVVISQCDLL